MKKEGEDKRGSYKSSLEKRTSVPSDKESVGAETGDLRRRRYLPRRPIQGEVSVQTLPTLSNKSLSIPISSRSTQARDMFPPGSEGLCFVPPNLQSNGANASVLYSGEAHFHCHIFFLFFFYFFVCICVCFMEKGVDARFPLYS